MSDARSAGLESSMSSGLAKQVQNLWESSDSAPDLFGFLATHSELSIADMIDAILADQRHRWKTDRPFSAEDYFQRCPNLAASLDATAQLVVGEYQARSQIDPSLDIHSFRSRFVALGPSFTEKLDGLLQSQVPTNDACDRTQDWYRAETRPAAAASASDSSGPLAASDPLDGIPAEDRIGRYRRERLLGEGAFGQVWLGADVELRRQVAIKMPTPDRFRNVDDQAAYLVEARALATLDHPHIVPVYDMGRTPQGAVYVVSKFVAGQDLAARFKQNRPSPPEAARIMAIVADALHHAHERRLIHRDVKPANILIEERTQRPYVADFGLAITAEDYLQDGLFAGTPAYMSPEQAGSAVQPLDGRSDLFSLGVVLYELLTGKRPFGGSTLDEVVEQVLFRTPTPPRELDDSIPPELQRICLKALAKQIDERYASGAELAEDLRRWSQEIARHEAAPKRARHNLPASRGQLIGRQRETAELQRQILDSRLVTLTGPGGIGKTRLSVEVGEQLLSEFADGVWLVELAGVREPTLLPAAIAQVLGCQTSRESSLVASLIEWIGCKRMLLLLDNFEHLMPAVDVVADLLVGCPGLHVLVTSRAVLRLSGEHEYPLSLLELPDTEKAIDPLELSKYPAIDLFVQRARETLPTFCLDEQNSAAVAQICARLDGLPLAIELAAARIKVLSPAAMLKRLQKRLALLVSGRRDAPDRQQNLRATIAWSHDLLPPDEQLLFCRLAVFSGGCTLEAAESIVALEGGDRDALEIVASLVDKSLLRHTETARGQTRFGMLETVREFALERLDASGDKSAIQRRHAEWIVALAEELESRGLGNAVQECQDRFADEYGNLRAALEWSVAATNATEPDAGRGELGLRLGGALWRFWCTRGFLREGDFWLCELLAGPGANRCDAIGAKARYAAGCVAEDLGDFARARSNYLEARQQWEAAGNRRGWADALIALGSISSSQGDFAAAEQNFADALETFRQIDDRRGVAVALSNLGVCAWSLGDYSQAKARHTEGLAIRRQLKNESAIAVSLTSLGLVAVRTGDVQAGQAYYRESLEILRRLHNLSGVGVCLNNLSETAYRLGEFAESRRLVAEAIAIQHEMGDRLSLAYSLESLATCLDRQGDTSGAVRMFATAEGLRALLGAPLPPTEKATQDGDLNALRVALGSDRFDAEWTAGQAELLDDVVQRVLM